MQNYKIKEVRKAYEGYGFVFKLNMNSIVVSIKLETKDEKKYLTIVEMDDIPMFYLTCEDIFERLVNKRKTKKTEKILDDNYIHRYEGIELLDYEHIFESLKENTNDLANSLIRYSLALILCNKDDSENLIDLGINKFVNDIEIPMLDLDECKEKRHKLYV